MRKLIYLVLVLGLISTVHAASNIDSIYKWAWNDAIGWIDFYNGGNGAVVTASKIEGSAIISNTGEFVSLDCATSPTGNICSGAGGNYFVSNDDKGNLAGWAWADSIGWISFCGNSSANSSLVSGNWICPDSPTYQVLIRDSGTGLDFSGYAWNDSVGWISFNSCNPSCGTIEYKVRTSGWGSYAGGGAYDAYLISRTYDTCPEGQPSCLSGVNYNYILWKGALNGSGNAVKFQLATSNCANGGANTTECNDSGTSYWGNARTSGDGAFVGPDGTSASYYPAAPTSNPNEPVQIVGANHKNKRYYRYQVFLDSAETTSPIIEDIVVNWSF